jgi:hypothetical protein
MLISPEVCRLLVEGRGWSLDQWERWLAGELSDALLGPDGTPSGAEAATSGMKPTQEGTITSDYRRAFRGGEAT